MTVYDKILTPSPYHQSCQSRLTFLSPEFGRDLIGGLTLGITGTAFFFFFTTSLCLPLYRFFLKQSQGIYENLIMCSICRFMVMVNNTIKYNSKIGQNTGISKIENSVIPHDMQTAFVADNLWIPYKTPMTLQSNRTQIETE